MHKRPIVSTTANAFVEDREACRAAGMNDQVVKPIEIEASYATGLHWPTLGHQQP